MARICSFAGNDAGDREPTHSRGRHGVSVVHGLGDTSDSLDQDVKRRRETVSFMRKLANNRRVRMQEKVGCFQEGRKSEYW